MYNLFPISTVPSNEGVLVQDCVAAWTKKMRGRGQKTLRMLTNRQRRHGLVGRFWLRSTLLPASYLELWVGSIYEGELILTSGGAALFPVPEASLPAPAWAHRARTRGGGGGCDNTGGRTAAASANDTASAAASSASSAAAAAVATAAAGVAVATTSCCCCGGTIAGGGGGSSDGESSVAGSAATAAVSAGEAEGGVPATVAAVAVSRLGCAFLSCDR